MVQDSGYDDFNPNVRQSEILSTLGREREVLASNVPTVVAFTPTIPRSDTVFDAGFDFQLPAMLTIPGFFPAVAEPVNTTSTPELFGAGPGSNISRQVTDTEPRRSSNPTDRRVRIRAKQSALYGTGILKPIMETGGCIFPYTPTVAISHTASWSPYDLVHTNYQTQTYTNSSIDDITIDADFTAQDEREAIYAHAAMHFFKTMTKMYFGKNTPNRGAPPPVLLLSGHGNEVLNDIPVVIKSVLISYGNDVDMVPVPFRDAWIPIKFMINITLGVSHSMVDVRDRFDLEKFRDGRTLGDSSGMKGFS